jgi:leucine dehydrogenase
LYAPDYIVNAGGVMNVFTEFDDGGYTIGMAQSRAKQIYNTMQEVISISKEEGISTALAADRIAEKRILDVRKNKRSV